MGIKERSVQRRKRIVGDIAANFEEAEQWDLEFWQTQSPRDRLSALMATREDIGKIRKGSPETNEIERKTHTP